MTCRVYTVVSVAKKSPEFSAFKPSFFQIFQNVTHTSSSALAQLPVQS